MRGSCPLSLVDAACWLLCSETGGVQGCWNLRPPASDARKVQWQEKCQQRIMLLKSSNDVCQVRHIFNENLTNELQGKYHHPTDKYWEILACVKFVYSCTSSDCSCASSYLPPSMAHFTHVYKFSYLLISLFICHLCILHIFYIIISVNFVDISIHFSWSPSTKCKIYKNLKLAGE